MSPQTSIRQQCSTFAKAAGIIATAVGVSVIVGWTFNIRLLLSVVPGMVPMNPATAICFGLLGMSLRMLCETETRGSRLLIGRGLAVGAAIIGLLKLFDHVLGINLPIDTLLFHEKLLSVAYAPNRMAPNTAANAVFFGLALLVLDVETSRGRRPAQYLALAGGVVSLTAVSAYAFQAFAFSSGSLPIPMALNTAVTYALLSGGVLMARPDRGVMAIITKSGPAGQISRRLLIAAIGFPIVLGWFRLWGQKAGIYGTEYGTTLFAITIVVVLSAVIWWNARWLDRSEVQRSRAEEDRESFFNLSLDLLCIANTDGYFTRVNPSWQRILGYTAEEMTAVPYVDFVHPDDKNATITETRNLSAGIDTMSFENRYLCKDGSYRWLLWNAGYSRDRNLIYGAARDITERKSVEAAMRGLNRMLGDQNAQLESANKELEAFSYSVSHDLRAPLRSIDGFSKALLDDHANRLDDDGKDALNRVRAATQRMGQLIDDMLNLSRVTRGEMIYESVDLSEIAGVVFAELQRAHPDRNVEIKIEPGLLARGDPRLLRIVLENLIGNAWKFTAKQTDAYIEFGRKPDGRFFVRDNGAGFDMAYAQKLFGAFQRLHGVKEFAGTGIGLATVQRIIHRHGGHVGADGAVGQGATFSFTVPSPDADMQQAA